MDWKAIHAARRATQPMKWGREWRAAMTDHYILEDGNPVPCDSLFKWARWMGRNDRHLARDIFSDVRVSTVFLGLDHSFGGSVPILWETMIFGGEHDQYQKRYSSKEEALAGHDEAVQLVVAERSEMGAKKEAMNPLPAGEPIEDDYNIKVSLSRSEFGGQIGLAIYLWCHGRRAKIILSSSEGEALVKDLNYVLDLLRRIEDKAESWDVWAARDSWSAWAAENYDY